MPEVVLFKNKKCHGDHKHLFASEPNLDASDDSSFNDALSSFVVIDGKWQFFQDSNYGGIPSNVFGPGKYDWVEDIGISNDSVSSVKLVG